MKIPPLYWAVNSKQGVYLGAIFLVGRGALKIWCYLLCSLSCFNSSTPSFNRQMNSLELSRVLKIKSKSLQAEYWSFVTFKLRQHWCNEMHQFNSQEQIFLRAVGKVCFIQSQRKDIFVLSKLLTKQDSITSVWVDHLEN